MEATYMNLRFWHRGRNNEERRHWREFQPMTWDAHECPEPEGDWSWGDEIQCDICGKISRWFGWERGWEHIIDEFFDGNESC
jgi:hypothetical protein